MVTFKSLPAVAVAALAGVANASLQVVPGATWTATNTGVHVQAHGAGVYEVDGVYYMIGEDKSDGTPFRNVNCYSSSNLVNWEYEGALLSMTDNVLELSDNRLVERPKVIYNDLTSKWVLWMHIDSRDYQDAKVGVATGDTICGQYEWQDAFRPLGHESRDMGLFKDDDGKGYLFTEDRPNGLRICEMNDEFTNVTREVYLWPENIESPAILKQNGLYYVMGSHLTGWNANDNSYSVSSSLAGPWSAWDTFADVGSNTYTSQSSFILPLNDTWAVYLGDRWVSTNLQRSTYIWLPLQIDGSTLRMKNRVNWIPDVAGGDKLWHVAPEETWVEAEDQTLENGAIVMGCSECSGGDVVGYIGGSSNGRVTFDGLHSDVDTVSTIRIKFANGDTNQRFARVTCNGVPHHVSFSSTGSGQVVHTSVVNCALQAGDDNTIVIDADSGGWGPDVDRLMIPKS